MEPAFWFSILLQLAAVGGALHITLKTSKLSWGLLAVAAAGMLLRRLMEHHQEPPPQIMAVTILVSATLLLGVSLVHREHSKEVSDLRALADSAQVMVWMTDADGQITHVNARYLRYTGRPLETIQKCQVWELAHPEDQLMVKRMWNHSMRGMEAFESEHRIANSSGVYRWFLARAQPVKADGQVRSWYGTVTDIDDTRSMLEKLKVTTGVNKWMPNIN